MKLYLYRGDRPNFGDELNKWLMPRIFPDFFDADASRLFLAIGSIINDNHPREAEKIVFGSGYGAYTPVPELDDNWKIYCVRGPLTAKALKLDRDAIAGDAAILMHHYASHLARAKRHIFSFIPHWQTLPRGNWKQACALAEINLIDPRRPAAEVLVDILESEVIIAEAMHGAIVSDALRIPWIMVEPLHVSHRYKWRDWAAALDLDLAPQRLSGSSTLEVVMGQIGYESYRIRDAVRLVRGVISAADLVFTRTAARSLRRISRCKPMLSRDAALNRALDRLDRAADRIRFDYGGQRSA